MEIVANHIKNIINKNDSIRYLVKKIYISATRETNKRKYIRKGYRSELGYRFRFSRENPYIAKIGDKTIIEDFNVWNARGGNIDVGNSCWFGIHNIIMGPVKIGDYFSSGPFVSILGPRHPTINYEERKQNMTVIGKRVMITTGSIITFGVTIGDNAIVAAGSVVTKDVPEGAFFAGNPARNLSQIAKKNWNMNKLVQERFSDEQI